MCKFKNIHLFVKKKLSNSNNKQNISETKKIFNTILNTLKNNNYNLSFDISCKELLPATKQNFFKNDLLKSTKHIVPNKCDLLMIIGGDGSILNYIRKTVDKQLPFLGINQGRLGFLADLNINKIKTELIKILSGKFVIENRSLLCAKVKKKSSNHFTHYLAVNDIVLCNNKIPKLIEFQIFINNKFVLQQRADGLIISTPTGSTAYSLSAGGPILYPALKIFSLVPLYPHTLTSRPLVISEDSTINLKILKQKNNTRFDSNCSLSFDGQEHVELALEDEVIISKYPIDARLIHPKNYNYFATLREKLGWNN